jgi:DNA-binding Lrp family transcriptional regulator
MERIQLDDIDRKILQELQEHGRISNVELASRVGLSPAPCLRRVRTLEESGVIQKYVALLDANAVELGVTVFVQVTLNLQVEGRLDTFEAAIMRRPEVLECYMMAGEADYLLRVVVPDVQAYERFLKESLTRIENVASFRSTFALKQAKYSTALPVTPAARAVPEPSAPAAADRVPARRRPPVERR